MSSTGSKRALLPASILAATLLLAACQQENIPAAENPAAEVPVGEAIVFTATSGDGAETRTLYSGVVESGHERIDWVEGDTFTIGYVSFGGADGLNADIGDYAVTGVTADGRYSKATIEPLLGEQLYWHAASYHRFFATYPAVDRNDEDFVFDVTESGLDIRVPYDYPAEQKLTRKGETGADARIFLPDMSHAYLFCNPTDYYGSEELEQSVRGGSIRLPFVLHHSAFEISVSAAAGETMILKGFTMKSEDTLYDGEYTDQIAGRFIYQYAPDPKTGEEVWRNVPKEGATTNQIHVDFSGQDVVLNDSEPVTFTVITNEEEIDYVSLVFEVQADASSEVVTRTLPLMRSWVEESEDGWMETVFEIMRFSASTKHRISGIRIPLADPVEPVYDSMQMVVTAGDETAWTFTMPFLGSETLPADLFIDWGDGTQTEAAAGSLVSGVSDALSHTYTTAGDYSIDITASTTEEDGDYIPNFNFYGSNESSDGAYAGFKDSRAMLRFLPTALLKMEGDGSLLFRGCSHLTTISSDLFQKNTAFTSFQETFELCSALSTIPTGLFDNCTNVITFDSTFEECTGLSGELPAGLFDDCTKVTTFYDTFYRCSGLSGSIPVGLFDYCTEVTSFEYTFCRCSGLSGSIPAGLFDKCTKVTSFGFTFTGCSGLDGSIPSGLFDNCTEVTSFYNTFSRCSGLSGSIPSGLFDKCTKVTNFSFTFDDCSGLTGSIPAGLFDYCTKVTSFGSLFSGCTQLSEMPSGLFCHNLLATDFSDTFYNCSSLQAVTDVFTGSDYTPATRFSDADAVSFSYCFWKIGGGTAPNLWEYTYGSGVTSTRCFENATNLTNYADIPTGWK